MGSSASKTGVTIASVSTDAYGFVSIVICMTVLSPPVAIHRCFGFLASFFRALVLATVPLLLALCQRDFALRNSVAEVNPQGNDRQTLRLGAPRPFRDLVLM